MHSSKFRSLAVVLLFLAGNLCLHSAEPATAGVSGANAAAAKSTSSPEAVVAALYHLPPKESPFFSTKNHAAINRFFARPLADLIWQDAVSSNGEVGALEADPLYDSQDPEPKGLAFHAGQTEGARSNVNVTFTDNGKKRSFTYQLVQAGSEGWKIADIRWTPQRTLLKTLQAAAPGKH